MSEPVMKEDKLYPNTIERIRTPDGTLFICIIEDIDNTKPIMIQINGPKTGSSIASWYDALARAINIALASGIDWMNFITEFSNITTSKAIRLVDGVSARSGPEAVAIALMRYRDRKNGEIQEEIDDSDDESDDVRPRWRIPPHKR